MGAENLTGQVLGQYELRALLGAGGMGAVYRAYQSTLKREVAVKVLPMKLANEPGYMERFSREAQIAAALEHPHIVPILDYGTQRGISYVVMRMLTGGALSQRMQDREGTKQPVPSLGEVADLLKQLGGALDYAHSQGVIHRDIKPSNVMFDNHGNAYLVDFGIAKLLQAVSKLTETGTTMGTPTYMSPEQWKAEELTSAADQYSLGVMAYELVTGDLPFQAETPYGLMHKHLNERPTPAQNIRRDVPEAITDVLERVMAKEPADRFPNVMAFALAFESAVRGSEGNNTAFFTSKVKTLPAPAKIATPIATPANADDATRIDQAPTITGSGNRSEYPTMREPYPQAKPFYLNPLVWVIGLLLLLLAAGGIFVLSSSQDDGEDNEISAEPTTVDDVNATIQAGLALADTAAAPLTVVAVEPTDEPAEAPTETADATEVALAQPTVIPEITDTTAPTESPVPTEVPSETPESTATSTEIPPSETPTTEPTTAPLPTDTPPPPTEMPTEVAVLAAAPEVVFHDTFSGTALSGEWDMWGRVPEVASDYMVFEGAESYSDVVARYELTNNIGVLIRFTHQPGYIDLLLESGNWEDDTFASWGLKNNEDSWNLSRAYGVNGEHFEEIASFSLTADTWYSLMLRLTDDSQLEVRLWEDGSDEFLLDEAVPVPESENWSDRQWTMLQRVHHGLLMVDAYSEYHFPPDFELAGSPNELTISLPVPEPAISDLVLDEPLTAEIQPGETAIFTFIPQADGVVAINVTSEAFDTVMQVRELGTDNTLVSDDAMPGETTNSAVPVLIVRAEEQYEIQVQSYAGDQGGEYTLTITETTLPEPIELTDSDQLDNRLESGNVVLYSFEGSEGETISAYALGDFDAVMELRRQSGELVWLDDDGGIDKMPYLPFVTLPGEDTYLLLVRGYDTGQSGDFTLVFERGEFELADHAPIELDTPVLGFVTPASTVSYLLELSSDIQIEVEAEAYTEFELNIYDEDSNLLSQAVAFEIEDDRRYAATTIELAPGVYHIQLVNPGELDSTYAIDVHEYEPLVQAAISAYSLSLYAEPSLLGQIVAYVSDDTLLVLGKTEDEEWLLVEYEGEPRWLQNLIGMVEVIGDLEAVPVAPRARVNAYNLSIYAEPSLVSPIVGYVNDETLLIVGKTEDELWLLVEYEDEARWLQNLIGMVEVIGDLENVPVME